MTVVFAFLAGLGAELLIAERHRKGERTHRQHLDRWDSNDHHDPQDRSDNP